MRRPGCVSLVCMLALFLTPRPADAHIWRWIEELSGPGPFGGITAEWRLKCWGEKELPKPVEGGLETTGLPVGVKFPCPRKAQEDEKSYAASANKYNTYSVNLETGWLVAKKKSNPIHYDDGQARSVYLFPIQAFLYYQPVLGVELGIGGGAFIYHHQDLYTFATPVIEPRIDVRPADFLLRKDRNKYGLWWGLLRGVTLRHGQVWFPRKITAQDFGGSASDRWSTNGELVPSFAIMLDFDPLMRKKVQPNAP